MLARIRVLSLPVVMALVATLFAPAAFFALRAATRARAAADRLPALPSNDAFHDLTHTSKDEADRRDAHLARLLQDLFPELFDPTLLFSDTASRASSWAPRSSASGSRTGEADRFLSDSIRNLD